MQETQNYDAMFLKFSQSFENEKMTQRKLEKNKSHF